MAIIMEDKKYAVPGFILFNLGEIFSCIEENKADVALFKLGKLQEVINCIDIDEIINS